MGADEHASRGDFAQDRIEQGPRLSVFDRVHPDQGTVDREQLVA